MLVQILPDGKVNLMTSEYEPLGGATAEVIESAEGQIWVQIKGTLEAKAAL